MAERVRAAAGRLLVGLVAAGALAGCAPRLQSAPARPADPDAVAAILRLEDRRDFDSTLLARYAASPSAPLRARTALALARLRRPESMSLLRTLLADGDTSVAATAAFALGQVGDPAAVRDLGGLLAPEVIARRPTVAAEAAASLGKLRSPEAADTLRALLSRAPLTAPAEPLGSALLAIWRFPRPSTLDPILRWLDARDPELRWRAAYALVRRPDARATPRLARLTTDSDPRVRALAVRGLGSWSADPAGPGPAATLPLIRAALQNADYSVRVNAVRALGSDSSHDAVATLVQTVAQADGQMAVAALESLGRLGPAAVEAADAVRQRAADPAAAVFIRQTALESLARIRPATATPLAESFARDSGWRLRASAARVFAAVGGPRDTRLAAAIGDPDGRVAAAALQAALEIAKDSVRPLRPLFLQALGSPDVFVRAAALDGLARLADPATLPQILDAYAGARRDTLDDAALAALGALGALKRAGLAPERAFFLRFDRSDDSLVRLRAAREFGADAAAAWGDPLPIDTHRSLAEYRALVDRFAASSHPPVSEPEVEIVTGSGTIRLRLFAVDAPLTVVNFLRLADAGYFDGQEWPRVVPDFVIQGGDPRGDTNGGPGYAIRDEINRRRYGVGTLGMALSGPDTGGSQFFITHSAQPHLDGIYTIFGEVVAGQAIAEHVLPGERIVRVRSLR